MTLTSDDAPPIHHAQAERALLGYVLTTPESAVTLADQLPAAAFYLPAHETIWHAVQTLQEAGTTPDHLAVVQHLSEAKVLQRVGGDNYLLQLREAADWTATPQAAVDLIRRAANRRHAAAALHAATTRLNGDPSVDPQAALEQAMDALEAGLKATWHPDTTRAVRQEQTLTFSTVAEVRARLAANGPRRYLVRGLWPAGTYGVHAMEQKGQKTWNATDLAVSVASGTPWLDHFPIEDPGPVLIFAGEGGEDDVLRRLDAIALTRGLRTDDLPIHVCARAPHLADAGHMATFRQALGKHRPRLVVLDPLYLAARGAVLTDLYAMGALLEVAQHACAEVNAALWVNHHHNRNRDARGSGRMSGAGPAEWGRVLISGKVVSRHTDPNTKETRVLTELEVIGGSVADDKFRIFRKIHADNPNDLNSPLRYSVEVLSVDEDAYDADKTTQGGTTLTPAQQKLLEALRLQDNPTAHGALVDWIADKYGHGLTRETVSKSLNDLAKRNLVDCIERTQDGGRWPQKLWFIPTPEDTP